MSGRNDRSRDERAAIARAFEASGLTQAEFAAMHGVAPRTLRKWLRRWAPYSPPGARDEACRIIDRAIAELQALRERVVHAEGPPGPLAPLTPSTSSTPLVPSVGDILLLG